MSFNYFAYTKKSTNSELSLWSVVWFILVGFWGVTLFPLFHGESVILGWDLGSFELTLIFDEISFLFLFMVVAVSSAVIFYTLGYMQSESQKKGFSYLMAVFIISMLILCVSGDTFTLIIGWDGLGLSSLFLILYFNNWNSLKGGLSTFLCNRLGDVALIFAISHALMEAAFLPQEASSSVAFCICIAAMTKSAQFPFSAWLPLAIAAPTPVSSLVHSSTLVTSGVYLLVRFSESLSEETRLVLVLSSTLTTIVASLSSAYEVDLNNIVAFSTLLHIGLMVLFVALQEKKAAIVHMVAHAFFKSLLFISAGELIHGSGGSQDIRVISLFKWPKSVSWPTFLSLMSMSGIPFLSGFYSKELLLGSSWSFENASLWMALGGAVVATALYSTRIFTSLFISPNEVTSLSSSSSNFLSLWSILSVLNVNFFLGSLWSFEGEEFNFLTTSVVVLFLLFGAWLGVNASSFSLNSSFHSQGMYGLSEALAVPIVLVRPLSAIYINTFDFMGTLSKISETLVTTKVVTLFSLNSVSFLPGILCLLALLCSFTLMSKSSYKH